jgi:hypothetical protein
LGYPKPKKPAPPQPTRPPQPPQPAQPAGPIADFKALARKLAVQLRDGKRKDVLRQVMDLSPADRDSLEAQLIPTLAKDRLKPQGIELRRIIRFARYQPPAKRPLDPFKVEGGSKVALANNKFKTGGEVTAMAGVTYQGTAQPAGYSLNYSGSDAPEMQWLQMIWRNAVQHFSVVGKTPARNVPIQKRFDHRSSLDMPYFLTTATDPIKKPDLCRWHADGVNPQSPFYEEGSPVRRTAGELLMVDVPSPTVSQSEADALFAASAALDSIEAGFHAETFLVHGMDVLYCVKIDLTWKYIIKPKPGVTTTLKITGDSATAIRGVHRARLAIQNPQIDFLPGDLASQPIPDDDFEPVTDLTTTGWKATATDAERLSDVAKAANTGQVQYLRSRYMPADIHAGTPFSAGLNVDGLKDAQGEVGYLDPKDNYSNPRMPISRVDRLPPVVTIIGSTAFHHGSPRVDYNQEFPVATMRHEMLHGSQAAYGIGWLVRWRDDFTDLDFSTWLTTQFAKSDQHNARLQVARAGATGETDAIEVLAYTEGFIAGIPFLPAVVDSTLLATKETWPSALRELQDGGTHLGQLLGLDAKAIQTAALARIQRYFCKYARPSERDALVKWLNAVMAPAKIAPPPPSSTITLVTAMFRGQSDWLKAIRDIAAKPCPS